MILEPVWRSPQRVLFYFDYVLAAPAAAAAHSSESSPRVRQGLALSASLLFLCAYSWRKPHTNWINKGASTLALTSTLGNVVSGTGTAAAATDLASSLCLCSFSTRSIGCTCVVAKAKQTLLIIFLSILSVALSQLFTSLSLLLISIAISVCLFAARQSGGHLGCCRLHCQLGQQRIERQQGTAGGDYRAAHSQWAGLLSGAPKSTAWRFSRTGGTCARVSAQTAARLSQARFVWHNRNKRQRRNLRHCTKVKWQHAGSRWVNVGGVKAIIT